MKTRRKAERRKQKAEMKGTTDYGLRDHVKGKAESRKQKAEMRLRTTEYETTDRLKGVDNTAQGNALGITDKAAKP